MEAFPILDQKAETVARVLVEEVICHHGAPERLLSDRGSNFSSELIAEVCRLLQIKKINTSGYHPQTDGLVEKFHQTLISMLSRYVEKHAIDGEPLPSVYVVCLSCDSARSPQRRATSFFFMGEMLGNP